jgi:hypothetical protein
MVFGKSFGSTRKLKTGSRFILEHRAAEGPANERCHHKLEPVPGAALSLLPNKCSLSVGANPLQYFDWRFYFLVRVNDHKKRYSFQRENKPPKAQQRHIFTHLKGLKELSIATSTARVLAAKGLMSVSCGLIEHSERGSPTRKKRKTHAVQHVVSYSSTSSARASSAPIWSGIRSADRPAWLPSKSCRRKRLIGTSFRGALDHKQRREHDRLILGHLCARWIADDDAAPVAADRLLVGSVQVLVACAIPKKKPRHTRGAGY